MSKLEKMQLHKLHEARTTEVKIEKKETFIGGGGDLKKHIIGTVEGRSVSLVERTNWGTYEAQVWKAFKDAGLPVVPTLRLDKKTGVVVVTDVKMDGSELYGKGLSAIIYYRLRPEYTFKRRPEIDKVFLSLMQSESYNAIVREVKACVEKANEHGLIIPIDDPFELKVYPDGHWELLLLDLSGGKILDNQQEAALEEMRRSNQQSAIKFIAYLKKIEQDLQS